MMYDMIEEMCSLLYSDEPQNGMELFLANAAGLAGVEGAAQWINPLFDAADRGDYLYMADILRYELLPKVT